MTHNNLINNNNQLIISESETGAEPRPAPLGIYYEICYPPSVDYKKIAYRRQARVHKLIDGRVSACLHMMAPMASHVGVQRSVETGHCHYSGVVICGSVWACPVCSTRIAFRRATELYKVDLTPYSLSMVTVTFSHHLRDPLKPMVKDLAGAWKAFRSGAPYQRMVEKYGIIGTICGTENRYGLNGWHPHKHTLYISKIPLDKEFYEWSANRWQRIAGKAGRYASLENGLNIVFQMSHDAKTYITKLINPENDEISRTYKWSLTDELTQGYRKSGNSIHPFQLLDTEKRDDDQLFIEYVQATSGMKSLVWSPGLKKLLGVEEKSDEELAVEDEISDELLFKFDLKSWLKIIRKGLRYEVLRISESEPETLVSFLESEGIFDEK